MTKFVALLRGINVGGHRKLPMAELRNLAEELGFADVQTYVASGNLLFASRKTAPAVEKLLEDAIEKHFGFAVDVMVRTAAQWAALCDANPMPAESARHPNLVMVAIGKRNATEADVAPLHAQAEVDEKVMLSAGAIYFYFGNGAGRSKMAAKASKGVWTTRNWRTATKLRDMVAS